MCVVYFSLTFLSWVPCPVVYTYYLAYTQSVGKSKAKKERDCVYRKNIGMICLLWTKEFYCLSSSNVDFISCDVSSLLKRNTVLLSLSLLYLGKYRLKKNYFCVMIEGFGTGFRSIPLTSGSGSGMPKNMWIRWIRIRNTGTYVWRHL